MAAQLLPAGRRPFHPARRTAHTRERGVDISARNPVEFVWHAALLVRAPVLLTRFVQYLQYLWRRTKAVDPGPPRRGGAARLDARVPHEASGTIRMGVATPHKGERVALTRA